MIHCHDGNVGKNEWITPLEITKSLGKFDLDPCAPIVPPWLHAKFMYTVNNNGLIQPWFGRVWLNPPYDSRTLGMWMKKMASHNNGIALLFNRSCRSDFHDIIYPFADSMLLLRSRITFYHIDGTRADANGGAPNVFFAYGEQNSQAIAESGLRGLHVPLNKIGVVVVGLDKSWKVVVKSALISLNNEASLEEIYRQVEEIAPDKIGKNKHYREKIRQTLQRHFDRVGKATYRAAA